jgi:hypothetical protein
LNDRADLKDALNVDQLDTHERSESRPRPAGGHQPAGRFASRAC